MRAHPHLTEAAGIRPRRDEDRARQSLEAIGITSVTDFAPAPLWHM
jgi:hypothetical protein